MSEERRRKLVDIVNEYYQAGDVGLMYEEIFNILTELIKEDEE